MKNALLITLTTLSLPTIVLAQSVTENHDYTDYQSGHHVLNINSLDTTSVSPDSIRSMIDLFYVDQFRHFQDPRAPYFLFMSKDANLAMGIGGVVRMRAWGDWNGSIPANGFVPYLIPVPEDPTQQHKLAATPAGTAMFFKVIGRNSRVGNYLAYIECNFDGYNNVGFKLKKAYVTVNDFTVGYSLTTFSDPAANPPTIDGAGPNGEINKSAVMLRWLHRIKRNWIVSAALEIPKSMVDADNVHTKALSDWTPDVIGFGQYEWDNGNQHVRLSGLLRMIPYRDLSINENVNKIGWGLQLSTVFKPFKRLTLYNSINVGEGIGSYTNDLQIGNYDLVADPDNPNDLYAPMSIGLTAGMKYNFTPNLYAGVAMGEMRYLPKHGVNDNEYKYGLYGAVNLFWDINPRLQVGIEYLYGRRTNFNGEHASANRCDALFQFSF